MLVCQLAQIISARLSGQASCDVEGEKNANAEPVVCCPFRPSRGYDVADRGPYHYIPAPSFCRGVVGYGNGETVDWMELGRK